MGKVRFSPVRVLVRRMVTVSWIPLIGMYAFFFGPLHEWFFVSIGVLLFCESTVTPTRKEYEEVRDAAIVAFRQLLVAEAKEFRRCGQQEAFFLRVYSHCLRCSPILGEADLRELVSSHSRDQDVRAMLRAFVVWYYSSHNRCHHDGDSVVGRLDRRLQTLPLD